MRLTKAHKKQIADAVLKPLKEKLFAPIEKRIVAMEEAWYHEVMDKYQHIVELCPAGFLDTGTSLTGFSFSYRVRGGLSDLRVHGFHMDKRLPKPFNHSLHAIPDDHPIRKEKAAIDDDLSKALSKYQKVVLELWAVMKPCNTDAKLVRVWPASAKIIEEEVSTHFPAPTLVRATKLEELLR